MKVEVAYKTMKIYLVFKEIDQYGHDKLAKAFIKKENAEKYIQENIQYNRSYIKEIELEY